MASIPRGAGAVIAGAFLTCSAAAADLFNNTNTGGVANKPTNQTIFLTPGSTHITELVTYHWNNGHGAPPGSISLKSMSGTTYGPFQAKGTSGQNNAPNVNWIADVNITVPIGTYIVVDSDPNTWSQNAQSHGAGFAIIRGEHVAGAAPPPTPPVVTSGGKLPPAPPTAKPAPAPVVPVVKPGPAPAPTPVAKPLPGPAPMPTPTPVVRPLPVPAPAPAPTSVTFKPCFVNAGSIASMAPCQGAAGTKIAIKLSRALKSPLKEVVFKPYQVRGIAGGTGAQVIAAVSGGATAAGSFYEVDAPAQLCIGGGGSWDLFPVDASGTAQGDIGRFTVDCRPGVAPITTAPKPTPAPAPPPLAATPFKPCFVNSGSIASSSPCNAHGGDMITIKLSRTLKSPLAKVVFKPYSLQGLPGATGAQVIAALSGGGLSAGSTYTVAAPKQLCLAGRGSWDLFPVDANGAAQGDIGRLNVQCP
jgi:hypothetical protein